MILNIFLKTKMYIINQKIKAIIIPINSKNNNSNINNWFLLKEFNIQLKRIIKLKIIITIQNK